MKALMWLGALLLLATFVPILSIATITAGALTPISCQLMSMPSPPGSVVVMTWNMWGDAGNLAGKPFRDRAPYMAERINFVHPDVLAGQESGWSKNGPWLGRFIEDETRLTAVGGNGQSKKGQKLWFNSERIELLQSGHWITPMGSDVKGAAWALFRQRESGQKFYVLSTHLNHEHNENSIRERQMRWLLDKMAVKNSEQLPIIVAGDLNSHKGRASGNAPIEVLQANGFTNSLELSSSSPTNDQIRSALGDHGLRTLEVSHANRAQIDYVFVTSGTPVHAWSLLPQSPIEGDKYKRVTSDHNAIVASLTPGGLSANTGNAVTHDSDPCTPDALNFVWSDGTDCSFEGVQNPRSCQQALAEAARIASDSPCRNDIQGGTWLHRCLRFVGLVYGYAASGTPTALQHYNILKARGLINTNQTDIPAGALVFFTTGRPAGHVAIYVGDGKAFSNGYVRGSCIDLTPMSTMSAGGRYLGWSPPVFPNGAPL